MDRGTSTLKAHVSDASTLTIRQTRRGWLQELIGCEARTEFRVFVGDNQIGHAIEDSECCLRLFCSGCYPFSMAVKELNTDAEMISIDRPMRCSFGGCKCCCYQEATVTSGGAELGSMKEDCWFCVPAFTVSDADKKPLYKMHPPTCLAGICVNCFAEGNPCGKGCCKVSFRIYPADQAKTDGDAAYIGKILKKPKSFATQVFTDSDAFELTFPEGATSDQKGILVGTSIFLNANFFEGGDQ